MELTIFNGFQKAVDGCHTDGVVFVAEALGGWLVEQLADAGRRKLTELILGSEQERALRGAADAAVWATAEEVSSSGGESAEQVAMVINEVFSDRAPAPPPTGSVMLSEGLQAGIGRQMAVLDDPDLTGTGQSSADVLGVPGAVLADRLTALLVREILIRGSGGGPLTPLADQLNHELTRLEGHLQGQRIEGMLSRLANDVQDAMARPDGQVSVAGWPLDEMTDPFVLEVHRPVHPDDAPPELPLLPLYVMREHDEALGQVAGAAADGRSGIAVLVGGSSVGKTRACWESLALLRDQDPPWRLWHPIDPSRPEAALRQLPNVGPRTVVWLNEAQYYLETPDGVGERVAAGLRELLRDAARSPVLVLATMWPSFWARLTARPPGGPDPHAQARELLTGSDINVPATITPAELQRLRELNDVRLDQAAEGAREGQVIQFLAGAPELLARYRNAPPEPKALIHAAMDGRRLGMRPALPHTFLETAAPGYLTDDQWDTIADDWMEQALAFTAAPCKGVRGPVTRIRPRPDRTVPGLSTGARSFYWLADYLDQYGRHSRHNVVLPASFWMAAREADPGDLNSLGDAARDRDLFRDAGQLYKKACSHGDATAGAPLVRLLHHIAPADYRPAEWAATHVTLEDPAPVAALLKALREVGANEQVAALLARDPASKAVLKKPYDVALLLREFKEVGADDQIDNLLARDPISQAAINDCSAAYLFDSLQEAGRSDQIAAFLARDFPSRVVIDDPAAVVWLLKELWNVGATDQAKALAARAISHAIFGSPLAQGMLLLALSEIGATEEISMVLAQDPASHIDLAPVAVAVVLAGLKAAKADEQISVLIARDPASHASINGAMEIGWLLGALRSVGATEQVASLLARDPASHSGLDNPIGTEMLLDALNRTAAQEQVKILKDRISQLADLRANEENSGPTGEFRYGLQSDGNPASPWDWDALD